MACTFKGFLKEIFLVEIRPSLQHAIIYEEKTDTG
jgi:hypothetical protein